jgi:type IX secretion system PorP/SprF family membrane protein
MIKFLALIFLFISSLIKAQDVHFSQFDKTKSLFNPAIIAHQSDDYQLQLQRRSQWSSVTVPFNTFALSLVAKDLYKDLSAAITLLNDVAGDSYFSTDGLNFSVSKTFYKKDNFISIGLIAGLYQRSVDFSNLVFLESENMNEASFNFLDIGIGVSHIKIINKNNSFTVGLSAYHLNTPNQSLNATENIVLNQKYIAHSTYSSKMNSKIVLTPAIYLSSQKQDMETIIGSGVSYKLDNKSVLKSGIYSRINDSFFMTFGINKGDFEAIISYDINTSSLANASKNMGGFEISVIYGWSIVKKKKEIKEKICPTYL